MSDGRFEGTLFQDAWTWANRTTLHPICIILLVACALTMILVPRRYGVLPIGIIACFIPLSQRLFVLGLNFDMIRLITMVGWFRLVLKGEARGLVWKPIDRVFLAWVLCGSIIYAIQNASLASLVNRLGNAFDAIGLYFLFRYQIRTWQDLYDEIACLACLCLAVALMFGVEYATGRNPFAVLGYVPDETLVREGRLRCQGAFAHPILAGCFWASLMPLIWTGVLLPGSMRILCSLAALASLFIVVACGSSTPVMSVIFAIIGAMSFAVRRHMRVIRWGILSALLALHLLMKAPVWHLISRIDIVGGNTSWHRYHLIDAAINRFWEWWLTGTKSTAHWDDWGQLVDVTNQYVLEGVRGGVLTLVVFILLIVLAFAGAGRYSLLEMSRGNRGRAILAWGMGVSLFVHCMNFLGVSYFGQISVMWYLILANIASLDPVLIRPGSMTSNTKRRSSVSNWRLPAG